MVETYRLSVEQFHSLAYGQGQLAAMRVLADGQLARRRLLVLAVATEIRRRGGAGLPALEAALALIGKVERRAFGVARQVLAYPHLPVWANRLLVSAYGTHDGEDSLVTAAAYLCALAASAAALAGLPFEIAVPAAGDALVLPVLGMASGIGEGPFLIRGDRAGITVTGRRDEIRIDAPFRTESRCWSPLRRVAVSAAGQRLVFAIEDVDPHRNCYPWPSTRRLSRDQAEQLADTCRAAWRLLVRHHPGHAEAMRVGLRSLVPLYAAEAGRHASATSRDAIGAIAVSVPTDPESLVELLLHEFQHTKLGALTDLVELYRRDARARHYAPWRPDPRPVDALLQGAYAHLGVAEYWRIRRSRATGPARRAADREFAYWRLEVSAALGRLRGCGELTDLGESFVVALADVLRPWQADLLPSDVELLARTRAQTRVTAWSRAHPHLAAGGAGWPPSATERDRSG